MQVILIMSLFRFGVYKKDGEAPAHSESIAASTSGTQTESASDANWDPSGLGDSESDSRNNDQPRKRKRPNPVRKYDPDYLKYGFISKDDSDGTPRPFCLVCKELLANSSMAPTKLKRHLENKHKKEKDKPLEYFQQLKADVKHQSKNMENY